jgi:hypothetical protein
MQEYPILFNQTSESLRRIGARGGRAYGRNRRARQKLACSDTLPVLPCEPPTMESTAQAIRVLDATFPWLRGAERRCDTRR